MPLVTKRVPPDLFVRYRGVRVYQTYVRGNYGTPSTTHYTTDRFERSEYVFDIRLLNEWSATRTPVETIKAAIRNKRLKIPPKGDHDNPKDDRTLEGGGSL